MSTVKEFKDLGVEFVEDDKIKGTGTSQDSFNLSAVLFGDGINHSGENCLTTVILGKRACNGWIVTSFAWRPLKTLPDNPKFKVELDASLHQWRPLLDQSVDIYACDDSGDNSEITIRYIEASKPSDEKPVFTQAMADAKSKFKSGQLVYIAQMNTLAGIVGKRYFVEQYWCGSLFQCEYVELGIIFDNKDDAEFKCKSLLSIDTRTPKQKAVDEMYKAWDLASVGDEVLDVCEALYHAGYEKKC